LIAYTAYDVKPESPARTGLFGPVASVPTCWRALDEIAGGGSRALAKAEPKTLRYRILHAAGRLVRSGRRRLKISATWPWATAVVSPWDRVTALPQPP
jgi:hypothetical protein